MSSVPVRRTLEDPWVGGGNQELRQSSSTQTTVDCRMKKTPHCLARQSSEAKLNQDRDLHLRVQRAMIFITPPSPIIEDTNLPGMIS